MPDICGAELIKSDNILISTISGSSDGQDYIQFPFL